MNTAEKEKCNAMLPLLLLRVPYCWFRRVADVCKVQRVFEQEQSICATGDVEPGAVRLLLLDRRLQIRQHADVILHI